MNTDDTFEAIFGIDDDEDAFSGDLADADPDAPPKGPRTLDNLARKLESMIRELRWAKRSLPGVTGAAPTGEEADETLLAQIDLLVVASWVRFSPSDDLMREPFRTIILRGARELGVKQWAKVAPTLDDLSAAAVSPDLPTIAAAAPSAKVGEVKTAQTALALLQKVFVLPGSIRLDAIFGDMAGYGQKKAALLLSETDPKKSARLAAELDRLNAAAVALMEANALPDEFSACLRALVIKSDLSLDKVAKRSGTDVQRLRHLLRGSQPRLDMGPFIHRLEDVLGVRPGTLWRLVKSPVLRTPTDAVYDDVKRLLFKAANVPADILGANWTDLSDAEKEDRVDWVTDNIILGTPYRRLQRIDERRTFRHAKLKDFMLAEFIATSDFKTADEPEASFPREVTTPSRGRRTIEHGGHWRTHTSDLVEGYIQACLTALKTVCADRDNAWLKESGLGFLIFPQVQLAIAKQIARRRCQQLIAADAFRQYDFLPLKGGKVYTAGDVNRIELTAGLFSPLTGYLFHNPPRFAPIPGVLTQSEIDAALADWPEFVKRSLTKIRETSNRIAKLACKVRDPWLPIKPLLERPDPLSPVYQGLDRMAADRPSFFGTPVACARHDQYHLVMSLLVHSCLRRANFGKLTWRPDNTGNLRWSAEGAWILQIPQRDMKNEGSGALPDNGNDLILELDPEDRDLYRAIDRWLGPVDRNTGIVDELGSSRRLIHGDKCSEDSGYALFPGEARDAGADTLATAGPGSGQVGSTRHPTLVTGVTDQTIGTIVYKFSTQYLVRCPWHDHGVAGVMPFGPHALRDLVATHVLKNTGSIEEAAAALFDTPETLLRHYARFTSLDKSRHTNATIRRTIKREPSAGPRGPAPIGATAPANVAEPNDGAPRVEQTSRDLSACSSRCPFLFDPTSMTAPQHGAVHFVVAPCASPCPLPSSFTNPAKVLFCTNPEIATATMQSRN